MQVLMLGSVEAALVIDTLMHQYSFTQGELTFLKASRTTYIA